MYNRYTTGSEGNSIGRMFRASGMPITWSLMGCNVLTFFLAAALPTVGIVPLLIFSTRTFPAPFFWTPLTWCLNGGGNDVLSLLFSLGWAYFFGGSVERAWGWRKYLSFLLATTVGTAVAVFLGSLLPGMGAGTLSGLWVAMAPMLVAWGAINREAVFSFFFLPIPGRFAGILGAVMAWYYGGAAHGQPLIGLFALAGCVGAWWYVTYGRYPYQGYREQEESGFFGGLRPGVDRETTSTRRVPVEKSRGWNPLRWWRERQERKKFEDIMRRSGFNDDEKRN